MHPELVTFLDDVRTLYPDLQIGEPDKQGRVLLTWQKWSINVHVSALPDGPTFTNIPNHSGTISNRNNPHGAMLRAFARQMTVGWSYYSTFETFQPGTLGFMAVLDYWMDKHESAQARLVEAEKNITKMIRAYADHMRHAHTDPASP